MILSTYIKIPSDQWEALHAKIANYQRAMREKDALLNLDLAMIHDMRAEIAALRKQIKDAEKSLRDLNDYIEGCLT